MTLVNNDSELFLFFKLAYKELINFIGSFNINTFNVLFSLAIASLLLILIWIYFIHPNWTKDVTEVGYGFVTKISDKAKKIDAINRARKLRKTNADHMPPPFPNGWFMIAESKNLKRGGILNVSCLGETFMIFRGENGKAHVLDPFCPHLGANIGVGGIVKGDCIECPFHLWSFRGSDGKCVNAAYTSSDIGYKNSKLKTWTSIETNGGIFVWHHVDSEEPWQLPVVKEIETGEWIYQGRNEFVINCHIQEIPENGADVAHLIAVHGANVFAGSDLRYSRAAWGDILNHWWHANWCANTNPEKKHQAIAAIEHSTRIFNKLEIHHLDVVAEQIGPSYVFLHLKCSLGALGILQTVTPVEPLLQKVVHRFYAPRKCSLLAKIIFYAECIMFERDMMIWNHKIYLNSPCLLKEDRNIRLYRNWYSQFYSANSKTFAEAIESVEW